jgi:hypothetical protein
MVEFALYLAALAVGGITAGAIIALFIIAFGGKRHEIQ